jgi:hypothetical protein
MAMTRKLWSISGLATEFDLDRRTVASRIEHIPPAGKLRGHDAWLMADVAPSLTRNDAIEADRGDGDPLLDTFVERGAEWCEIHENDERDWTFRFSDMDIDPRKMPFDLVAQFVGKDRDTILHWLRCGCPYREEGNWETGDGFSLSLPHVIDWSALVFRATTLAAQNCRDTDRKNHRYMTLLRVK